MKLTKDLVPVVIHDATLDRTTPCTGQVNARTYAELRADCPSDILGTDGQLRAARPERPPARADPEAERGARAGARHTGARVNLEIKNQPTDPDFDKPADSRPR